MNRRIRYTTGSPGMSAAVTTTTRLQSKAGAFAPGDRLADGRTTYHSRVIGTSPAVLTTRLGGTTLAKTVRQGHANDCRDSTSRVPGDHRPRPDPPALRPNPDPGRPRIHRRTRPQVRAPAPRAAGEPGRAPARVRCGSVSGLS